MVRYLFQECTRCYQVDIKFKLFLMLCGQLAYASLLLVCSLDVQSTNWLPDKMLYMCIAAHMLSCHGFKALLYTGCSQPYNIPSF